MRKESVPDPADTGPFRVKFCECNAVAREVLHLLKMEYPEARVEMILSVEQLESAMKFGGDAMREICPADFACAPDGKRLERITGTNLH